MIIHRDTTIRRANLPHLQRSGASYFVTSRLDGSIPQEVIADLRLQSQLISSRLVDANRSDEAQLEARNARVRLFSRFDRCLDTNDAGPHWLKDSRCADTVAKAILNQDGLRASIDCFTIMSNHIHLLMTPMGEMNLDKVMKGIKQQSAFYCLQIANSSTPFWEPENHDHILRDGEWGRIAHYIIMNPVKAGLCNHWRDWPYTYISEEVPGLTDLQAV